jgi:hypothetical protein
VSPVRYKIKVYMQFAEMSASLKASSAVRYSHVSCNSEPEIAVLARATAIYATALN